MMMKNDDDVKLNNSRQSWLKRWLLEQGWVYLVSEEVDLKLKISTNSTSHEQVDLQASINVTRKRWLIKASLGNESPANLEKLG